MLLTADSRRAHSFTKQVLPQILEDEVGERNEEENLQTREREDSSRSATTHLKECECDEGVDHSGQEESGLSSSDCSDELCSGSVSPNSIDREQTMDGLQSDTTSLDSGCNMSQS